MSTPPPEDLGSEDLVPEDLLAEALALRAGLHIALRDHRAEVLDAARRAHAQAAALLWDLPPEAEPSPALRLEPGR